MKKILALGLSLIMLLSSGSAFAVEYGRELSTEKAYREAAKMYTEETAFADVKKSDSGAYALEQTTPYGKVLVPVGLKEVNAGDALALEAILEDEQIHPEVKKSIEEEYERALRVGNTALKISYFSPDFLESTRAAGGSDGTIITVYNGASMKSERVYYTNVSTGWTNIASGSTVKSVISGITDISLIGISLTKLAFVATGISLLQAFINAYSGFTFGGTYDDYAQADILYNKTEQWTYRMVDEYWKLGLVSESVTILELDSEVYFWNSSLKEGKRNRTEREVTDMVISSDNFSNPWATAYQHYQSAIIEEVSWKVGSKTCYF